MKKILGLAFTTAIFLSSASSLAIADHHEKLEDVAKKFEKLAVESGKLNESDKKCWGEMKKSLDLE